MLTQSAYAASQCLSHRQHELAKVAALFHAREDGASFGPGKLLTHWPQLGQFNGTIHLHKVATRTDIDSLELRHLMQHKRHWKRFRALCKNADLRHCAADAQRLQ